MVLVRFVMKLLKIYPIKLYNVLMIEALKDKSKLYCNNAGGSQMLNSVIDYMTMYMQKYHVKLNCENEVGDDANNLVKEAKQFVDILINNTNGNVEYG